MKKIFSTFFLFMVIFLLPLAEVKAQTSCVCQTSNTCSTSCTFDGKTSTSAMSCLRESAIGGTVDQANKDGFCNRNYRYKGDADGLHGVDSEDYFYYVRVVNGGTVPVYVNPDFNGDGFVSSSDRVTVVTTIKNGGIIISTTPLPLTTTPVPTTTVVPVTTTVIKTTTPIVTTTPVITTTQVAYKYNNGSYTYSGQYYTHQGIENYVIDITVTNDIVTSVNAYPSPAPAPTPDPESVQYQKNFKRDIVTAVVGKPLDDATKISTISGASLTTAFFKFQAVPSIQTLAKKI